MRGEVADDVPPSPLPEPIDRGGRSADAAGDAGEEHYDGRRAAHWGRS